MEDDGAYRPARHPVNARNLQPELDLKFSDQTLAVYPAPLAPPPYPWPAPMDREAGIAAYEAMITADEHRARRAAGVPPEHVYTPCNRRGTGHRGCHQQSRADVARRYQI